VNRQERTRLLARVNQDGYSSDYRGIRISATGKRLMIERATVWNLVGEQKRYYGQGAVFDQWSYGSHG
jgi:hypothetical protein